MHFLPLVLTLATSLLARAASTSFQTSGLQSDDLSPSDFVTDLSQYFPGSRLKDSVNGFEKRAEPQDGKPESMTVGRLENVDKAHAFATKVYGHAYGRLAVAQTNHALNSYARQARWHQRGVEDLGILAPGAAARERRMVELQSQLAKEAVHRLGHRLDQAQISYIKTSTGPPSFKLNYLRKVKIPKEFEFTVEDAIL